MAPKMNFFVGKGGVGKSTISAVASLNFAKNHLDTLLVSMDPAHNQRDIFDKRFSEKPMQVAGHLTVKEIDIDFWIKRYLKDTKAHLKRTYAYQSAYNLDGFFNILQFSPGLEEYAMIQAFENVLHSAQDKDVVVFDMPPTALTLRFFSLPFITLVWLKELLGLRNRITEKKEIVSKIKWGKREIEQDKVKSKLTAMIGTHRQLRDLFLSGQIAVNLVMNNDKLSFSESVRIERKLADIGIPVNRIVVNKMAGAQDFPENLSSAFHTKKITGLPLRPGGLAGMEPLNEYTDTHRNALMDI